MIDFSVFPPSIKEVIRTHDDEVRDANFQKQMLISDATDFINSRQWQGKAALGRLKEDELKQYNLWLDYLEALELVDTSSAPDIEWPTLRQFRPDDIRRGAGICCRHRVNVIQHSVKSGCFCLRQFTSGLQFQLNQTNGSHCSINQ
nr:unnamed protein product [Escherichia coli]